MLTNNFIESWHNQLKALYLKHIRNKRLDRLIFILTHEVESYFDRERERILSNSGRMAPLRTSERGGCTLPLWCQWNIFLACLQPAWKPRQQC